MKKLFDPIKVGGLSLKNRLIRSATFESAYDDQGDSLPTLSAVYGKLAEGGVGAIITGMVGIDANSRVAPTMVKAYDDAMIPQFEQLAKLVHAHDCKLVVQLSHCGVKAIPDNGHSPLGPSDMEISPDMAAKGMDKAEIADMARHFAAAAVRGKKAGADAVQIHGAHGYLLSQFLSPYYNKRTDEYGGDIKGRGKALLEVYDAVRKAVGPDYPVWVKINCKDLVEGGSTTAEYFQICAELDKRGIDAIELSAGLGTGRLSNPAQPVQDESKEGSYAAEAVELSARVKTDIISVGGYRTPKIMEEWLNKGNIAALSLSRPLISQPDLPNKWKKTGEKARCISCNKCFRPKAGYGCQVEWNKAG